MLIRMLADAGMVAVALAIALGLRLLYLVAIQAPDGTAENVQRYSLNFLVASPLIVGICLISFWFCGFYTYSQSYLSRYKALVVLQGVSIGYVAYAFLTFFFARHLIIARGAWFLGWLITAAALVAARIWSDIYKKHVSPESAQLIRQNRSSQRVLVIGGGGYIGSALIPELLDRGMSVRLLDVLLFGDDPISEFADHPRLEIIRGNFRDGETVLPAVQDVDAVVHLGAIVGDPACNLNEELTIDVNLVATRMIAELSKAVGVRRFIFASTCSVYGASDDLLDERSAIRPVSLYGDTKRASEDVLLGMADDTFSPTILRFATIYGLSGRTRFDLVVNLLTAKAKIDGEITVHGGGQWRPFVHVQDAARSIALVVDAAEAEVAGEVFNVGSNEQNYTIMQIAEMVRESVVGSKLVVAKGMVDHRNYRVSFNKIHRQLGFGPIWTVEQGIAQVLEAIASGEIQDYSDPRFSNAKFLTERGTSKLEKDSWARQLLEDLTNT